MERTMAVLQDVEMRLRALAEARRLRPEVSAVLDQVRTAKQLALESPDGSPAELQHLQEAAEASRRLAGLRTDLLRAEQELRRTRYLLDLLSE